MECFHVDQTFEDELSFTIVVPDVMMWALQRRWARWKTAHRIRTLRQIAT